MHVGIFLCGTEKALTCRTPGQTCCLFKAEGGLVNAKCLSNLGSAAKECCSKSVCEAEGNAATGQGVCSKAEYVVLIMSTDITVGWFEAESGSFTIQVPHSRK